MGLVPFSYVHVAHLIAASAMTAVVAVAGIHVSVIVVHYFQVWMFNEAIGATGKATIEKPI